MALDHTAKATKKKGWEKFERDRGLTITLVERNGV
jgi:hypothetical protein